MSPKDRRALLIGITSIGSLAALSRGVPAFRAWESDHANSAASIADRLAFAKRVSKTLPALRDSLTDRRRRAAHLDSVLVGGNSPAAAAAALASIVEEIADSSDVKVNAMQIRADTVARMPLSRVAVRITGVADVAGLSAFLHAIEGDERPLAVRELSVSQPEPAAADSKVEMLRVDILVETIASIKQEKSK